MSISIKKLRSYTNNKVTLADFKRNTFLIMEIMDLKTSIWRREMLVKDFPNEYKSKKECFNDAFKMYSSTLALPLTKADKDEIGVTLLLMVEIINPKISAKQRETLVKQLNFTITPAELEREFANILVS